MVSLFGSSVVSLLYFSTVVRAFVAPSSSRGGTDLSASIQAILWDMDGVLADTERDGHRVAFNQAFEENGFTDTVWDVDLYGRLLETGGGKERMTAYWNEKGEWPFGEENRQDKVKELHLRKTDIFMDMIRQNQIPLRPGVARVVDAAIAADIRLAVCSTSNVDAVTNLVNTLLGAKRAKYFSIFAGDMVANKKPAPDVYNMAVDEMQLDKDRCIIVEDSSIGFQAAKAAGICCIVTKSSYTKGEDFTGANLIVDELGDDANTGVTLELMESLVFPKATST